MFIFAYILFGLEDALLNIHVPRYYFHKITILYLFQKQRSRGVLRKRCSENMQQVYRRAPMPKCYFNKVALQLY